MLDVRQWRHVASRHVAFCVSRQHRLCRRWPGRIFMYYSWRLLCLFFVSETTFTISESRTISHVNDTQAQQVAPNPRRGRFSTETLLERERRLEIQREQRREKTSTRNRRAETWTSLSTAKATPTTRDRGTEEQETGILEALWSFFSVENTNLLVCRFLRRYIDQSLQSCSSVLKNGPKYNNFHANCTTIFMLRFCFFLNPEPQIMLNMLLNTLLKITPHNTQKRRRRKERATYGPSRRYSP